MIPGIGVGTEAVLAAALEPRVTDLGEAALNNREFTLLSAEEDDAARLGIRFTGGPQLTIVVTDPGRRLGEIRVQTGGKNNVMFFDNANWAAIATPPSACSAANASPSSTTSVTATWLSPTS